MIYAAGKCFPILGDKSYLLEMSFRYPWAKSLVISRQTVEFNHVSGYNQRVALHWVRTYYGKPRPILVCTQCHCGARRLFLRYGSLKCRFCHGLRYASEQRDSITRKRLTAAKLRLKLGGWPDIREPFPPKAKWKHKKRYQRLRDQAQVLEAQANQTRFRKQIDIRTFAYHVA